MDRSRVRISVSACLVASGLIIGGAGGALAFAQPEPGSGDGQSNDPTGGTQRDPGEERREKPTDPPKPTDTPKPTDPPKPTTRRPPKPTERPTETDRDRPTEDRRQRPTHRRRPTRDTDRDNDTDRDTVPDRETVPRPTAGRTTLIGRWWRWRWLRAAEYSHRPRAGHAASTSAPRSGTPGDTLRAGRHRLAASGSRGSSAPSWGGVCRRGTDHGRWWGSSRTDHVAGGRGPVDRTRGSRFFGHAAELDAGWGARVQHLGAASWKWKRTAAGQCRRQQRTVGLVPRRIHAILAHRRYVADRGLRGAGRRGSFGAYRGRAD